MSEYLAPDSSNQIDSGNRGPARNRTWLAINLITPAGGVATCCNESVDAPTEAG